MRLGSYLLQATTGADAWSTRYRAYRTLAEADLAAAGQGNHEVPAVEVCVFRPAFVASSEWPAVRRRLRLTQLVTDDSLNRVIQFSVETEPVFLVLESCCERTLSDAVNDRSAGNIDLLKVCVRLVHAVAAAHRTGLIHGDLSPAHILFRRSGQGRPSATEVSGDDWVIDFSRSDFDTAGGDFRAPETLSTAPTFASDVFSLAAVLKWLTESTSTDCPKDLVDELRRLLAGGLNSEVSQRPSAAALLESVQQLANRTREDSLPPASPRPLQAAQPVANDATLVTTSPPPLALGGTLGRFQLQRQLGMGAMGIVFLARDPLDDSQVAIKVLSAANDDTRRRFAKEARLLQLANCPYVASLLEYNEDDGNSFLAIEFVPGGALSAVLADTEPLPEHAVLALVADAARGLSVAHQRGLIHRDIKPDNVLLTEAGQAFAERSRSLQNGAADSASAIPQTPLAKLADFGIARAENQTESLALTQDGAIMGTPLYMSPEQCRGESVDARSDVYSFGAMLFHLLAGRPPFDGDSHVAVMNKHCHEPLPSLKQLRRGLSDATIRVTERCLARHPGSRYMNAGELSEDLDNLLRGTPTSLAIHPPTPSAEGLQVQQFSYTWDLDSSPTALWPFVSHTDRVNHALGLPAVRYTTRVHPEKGVERFAEMKIAGQKVAWQEHPYEWIRGRRMSVLREFSRGPFEWFVNVVELAPRSGGGCRLTQTFTAATRSWLGRFLARRELGEKSRRNFGRAYQKIDQFVLQGNANAAGADAFGVTTSLPAARQSRLASRLARLGAERVDPQIIETLGQFLEHASDPEVARIRPLAFAERFGLDPRQTVTACLLATREGLLRLLWDILCPSCRIPADVQETLAAVQQHGYCEACNVKYELDLAKSVELIFTAHPEIRTVETKTYCIGGPAWSAHVIAQVRVAAGERFLLEVDLEEGDYRIRGPQLPFVVDLRAGPRGVRQRMELPLSRPQGRDAVPLLLTGTQAILLHNDTPVELHVRLERTASDRSALTAADASALPLFREMFPDQVLSPGQIVSVAHVTLLAAQVHGAEEVYRQVGDGQAFGQIRELLDQLQQILDRHRGAVIKTIGDGLLVVFAEPLDALHAALEAAEMTPETSPPGDLPVLRLRVAVHQGAAMVTTINDRLDYFGRAIHLLDRMLAHSGAGEILISDVVAGTPEAAELLQSSLFRSEVVTSGFGQPDGVILRMFRESDR